RPHNIVGKQHPIAPIDDWFQSVSLDWLENVRIAWRYRDTSYVTRFDHLLYPIVSLLRASRGTHLHPLCLSINVANSYSKTGVTPNLLFVIWTCEINNSISSMIPVSFKQSK